MLKLTHIKEFLHESRKTNFSGNNTIIIGFLVTISPIKTLQALITYEYSQCLLTSHEQRDGH